MEESQGFEPWVPCGTPAFEAGAIVRSANSPLFVVGPTGVEPVTQRFSVSRSTA